MHQHFSRAARDVRGMTTGRAAAHLLTGGPYEAQFTASFYCSGWYVAAPPQLMAAGIEHPAGSSPNLAMLRLIDEHFSSIANPHAALVLTRALHSLFPDAEEAIEVTARLEMRLVARGASAPAWSLQLDEWELEAGHELRVDDEDGAPPRRSDIACFAHPGGDRHAMMITHDRDGHLHRLDAVEEIDASLAKLRALFRTITPGGDLIESDPEQLAEAMAWSVELTHAYDFRPIRFDTESISFFALLSRRLDSIRSPARHR